MLIGGAVIATLLLLYLFWPSGETQTSNVDLVPAAQRQGVAPPPAAPVPLPPSTPVPVPTVQAVAAPEGIVLHGVTGGGAIIGYADGSQRFIARGRDVLPGLRLQGTSLYSVILGSPTASYRLGFSGPAVALGAPVASPGSPPAVAVNPTAQAAEAQRAASDRAQTQQFRQLLAPREVNGRITGYTIRPGANAPPLQQAGLLPGDTILSVNGSQLQPEQLEELAWTIANSSRTEFEIERGGRRMRFAYQAAR